MEMSESRRPAGISWGWATLYNLLAVPLGVAFFHLSRFSSPKVRDGIEGRHGQWRRLEAVKDRLQGGIWFHASSVGEYEQARPILRALREEARRRQLDLPIVVTVFSPSGYHFAQGHDDADFLDYLPLDTALSAWRMVRILRPRALVFVKFDCWPNMIWAARRAQVPVFLLDATLHRKSGRLAPVIRSFFGRLFDSFHTIAAISESDARRFTQGLGTSTPVRVTGDTRTDQVVHRWREAESGPLARMLGETPWRYLALGSIWPPDEERILHPALRAVADDEHLGLILVPHEPQPEHLEKLEEAARREGLEPTRLSRLIELPTRQRRSTAEARDPARWRCIVVDTVGVLPEIYRSTLLSYVGGSFSTGVHNVLEPAVCGQPVLFGPRIHNAYEAERLVERGAGFVIHDEKEAEHTLRRLLDDEELRQRTAAGAQDFVLSQSGATEASVAILRPALFPADAVDGEAASPREEPADGEGD